MVKMQKRVFLTKEDQAKYPFLKEATNFVENFGVNLRELSIEDYPSIIPRATQWIQDNIEGNMFTTNIKDPDSDILAYPLALAFLFGLKKEWVINRFATSEQKRIKTLLLNENPEHIIEIAKSGFGWDLESININQEEAKFQFSISVANYLEIAPQFHSAEWKLINRYVDKGKVYLRNLEYARLLSGAAENKIKKRAMEEEVRKFELPEKFKPYLINITKIIEQKKDIYDEETPLIWVEEAKPPCVIAMLNDIESGKNLSHMARFTISTFMLNVGKKVEDVLELFSRVPDFDEGKTRYQIEHIAGEIGSKQKYKMPKCDVLRSFGLCVGPDALCEEVWYPLIYYRKKIEEMKKRPSPVPQEQSEELKKVRKRLQKNV
jgi:DNA primase large subunit